MASKRQHRDGADAAQAIASYLQTPAANGFLMSQKLAMEATRFWARRMRAYADQMEEFARCSNPDEYASAQKRFLDRMQEEYARETTAFSDIFIAAKDDAQRAVSAARQTNGAEERPQA